MSDKPSRELTPADLRVLEPDVLGAVALVLYGRSQQPRAKPGPPRAPASWRGGRRP
jgi:hypothetical protein